VSAPLQRLVAAHRAALAGLRPVADPPARLPTAQSAALVGALAAAEQAYDRLAHATSAAGFNAARTEVVAADRGVDGAVARLARAGAPAVQRPPASAAPRSGGGASLLTLLLVLATALLVSALAPACLRRARTRDTRPDPSLAAKPCVLAARRRTPIAPPPTYGRWNEAPRGPGAAPEGRRPDDRYGVVVDNVNVSVLE
jgi:hypothetical protein